MHRTAVVVITQDPRRLLRKSNAPRVAPDAPPEAGWEPVEVIELTKEPPHFTAVQSPIQVPARLVSWFDRQKWRLAVHEAGHALAGLLFGGYSDGVALVDTGDSGEGRTYTNEPDGLPTVRVGLAGLAAERLVDGDPLDQEFFENDVKNARRALIDLGTREEDADAELVRYFTEVHSTFAQSWTRALRSLAEALFARGFLHGDAVASIAGRAQARLAKSMNTPSKTYVDRVSYAAPAQMVKSHFDELAADLTVLRADELNEQAGRPGLTAHEVAVLESQRNRIASQAAAIRRGNR